MKKVNSAVAGDGGMVNNFPTDTTKQIGADTIIGVDIRSDYYAKEELKSMENIENQLISFLIRIKMRLIKVIAISSSDSIYQIILFPFLTNKQLIF